jgi:hypothetical protein
MVQRITPCQVIKILQPIQHLLSYRLPSTAQLLRDTYSDLLRSEQNIQRFDASTDTDTDATQKTLLTQHTKVQRVLQGLLLGYRHHHHQPDAAIYTSINETSLWCLLLLLLSSSLLWKALCAKHLCSYVNAPFCGIG